MNIGDATLLLTRPGPAAQRFLEQVRRELGDFGAVVISPLMEIVPLPGAPRFAADAELILTSTAAIETAAVPLAGRRAWCVGDRTAACARTAGAEIAGVARTAAALTALIDTRRPATPLVHLAGRHHRDLAGALRTKGLRAETCVIYDQRAQPLTTTAIERLAIPGDIVAPSFSPRSTQLLAAALADRRARVHLAAISPAAMADWAARLSERLAIAPTPDAAGMIAAMGSLFDADPSLEANPAPS